MFDVLYPHPTPGFLDCSVADPKQLFSDQDPDPTCQVITDSDSDPTFQVIADTDPNPIQTFQVVSDPDPIRIFFVKFSQDMRFKGQNVKDKIHYW